MYPPFFYQSDSGFENLSDSNRAASEFLYRIDHAAAAPGTVTELISDLGIADPVIPL